MGEGPVWSDAEQVLWWVDIIAPSLHRFDPATGADDVWVMPSKVGCIALCDGAKLIVALETGFAVFDPASGSLAPIGGPCPAKTGARFNDGTVSPEGHFLVTTMQASPPFDDPIQTVQALHRDFQVTELISGLRIGNGLAFSIDGRTLFVSDTHPEDAAIWAFDWHPEEAQVSNRRLFFETTQIAGRPDGAAVDAEGFYWFAAVGGWQIVRLTPDGRLDRTVAVPVEKPSKLAFGGPDLSVAYVTSISAGLSAGSEPDQPDAGGLFAVELGVRGFNMTEFNLPARI